MKLYRLIYVSDKREYLGLADFKDILAKSEKNNAEFGITGLLVALDKKFFQVLEGPGAALNTLYEKIMRDPRHKNPRLLSYLPVHDRHFSEWAMKGINWSGMNVQVTSLLLKKYGESGGSIVIPDDPWLAFSLLYDIYCNAHFLEWAEPASLPDPGLLLSEKKVVNYQRYRVLVVEDDALVRRIILRMLQHMGFRYLGEADNGASALQEVEKFPPDLILCDIEMKPMDGLSFLQVLRQTRGLNGPKFIFLSGNTEPAIVNRAHALGIDAFISKPIKADQLRYQIDHVIGHLNADPTFA